MKALPIFTGSSLVGLPNWAAWRCRNSATSRWLRAAISAMAWPIANGLGICASIVGLPPSFAGPEFSAIA